jgi:hypothetical protein
MMAKKRFSHSPKGYDVGYGRPPRSHQWKLGQSGNPSGKKKGVKNRATILNAIMQRKVTITDNGKPREITLHEGLYLKYVAPALKGDLKAAAFLLNQYEESQNTEAVREVNRVAIPQITDDMTEEEALRIWTATLRQSKADVSD